MENLFYDDNEFITPTKKTITAVVKNVESLIDIFNTRLSSSIFFIRYVYKNLKRIKIFESIKDTSIIKKYIETDIFYDSEILLCIDISNISNKNTQLNKAYIIKVLFYEDKGMIFMNAKIPLLKDLYNINRFINILSEEIQFTCTDTQSVNIRLDTIYKRIEFDNISETGKSFKINLNMIINIDLFVYVIFVDEKLYKKIYIKESEDTKNERHYFYLEYNDTKIYIPSESINNRLLITINDINDNDIEKVKSELLYIFETFNNIKHNYINDFDHLKIKKDFFQEKNLLEKEKIEKDDNFGDARYGCQSGRRPISIKEKTNDHNESNTMNFPFNSDTIYTCKENNLYPYIGIKYDKRNDRCNICCFQTKNNERLKIYKETRGEKCNNNRDREYSSEPIYKELESIFNETVYTIQGSREGSDLQRLASCFEMDTSNIKSIGDIERILQSNLLIFTYPKIDMLYLDHRRKSIDYKNYLVVLKKGSLYEVVVTIDSNNVADFVLSKDIFINLQKFDTARNIF